MTEKSIYQKGKFKVEEWEDVNYCQHCFYNDEEPLWENNEVVDLLNGQDERIQKLKGMIETYDTGCKEIYDDKCRLEKQFKEYHDAVDEEYLTIQSTTQTLLTHLNYKITNKKTFKEHFTYEEYMRIKEFLTALSILNLDGLNESIKELKQ